MKLKIAIAACLAAALVGCSQRGGSGSNGADRTPDQQSNPTGSGSNPSTQGKGNPDASGGTSGTGAPAGDSRR